jgi:hypothetical protein
MTPKKPNDWPFSDPPNTAVLSTREVMNGEKPILFVFRDSDDGAWQFHCHGEPKIESAVVIGLREIVSLDPTVLSLADLPVGWKASRSRVTAPWNRQPE